MNKKDIFFSKKFYFQGFGNWKKSEFYAFVRGCEKYGRTNIARITEEIGTKTEDEVKEYSQAFWKKYKQIPGSFLFFFSKNYSLIY